MLPQPKEFSRGLISRAGREASRGYPSRENSRSLEASRTASRSLSREPPRTLPMEALALACSEAQEGWTAPDPMAPAVAAAAAVGWSFPADPAPVADSVRRRSEPAVVVAPSARCGEGRPASMALGRGPLRGKLTRLEL